LFSDNYQTCLGNWKKTKMQRAQARQLF
jgi:hypothetical protein